MDRRLPHAVTAVAVFSLSLMTSAEPFPATALAAPASVPTIQDSLVAELPESSMGYLFRVAPGMSYAWTNGGDYRGAGADLSLAFGIFFSDRFAFLITGFGSSLFDLKKGGYSAGDLYFYGGGIGVTCLGNSGTFGSLSFFLSKRKASGSYDSTGGESAELLIGHNWKTNERVSLGVALGALGHHSGETASSAQNSVSLSLRFVLQIR